MSERGLGRELEDLRHRIGPALCAHPAPCGITVNTELVLHPDGTEEAVGEEPPPLCASCPERESGRLRVRWVQVVRDLRNRDGRGAAPAARGSPTTATTTDRRGIYPADDSHADSARAGARRRHTVGVGTRSPGTPEPRRARQMGQVARLDKLAERIKAEHLACDAAISDALGHALGAGDLLIEAKTRVGWGDWEEWVVANCGVSVRRAQEYMQLARSRDKLGEVKARGPALLSIEGALKTLRRDRYLGGWQQRSLVPPVPGTTPLTPEQEKAQRAREREQQRLQERAEYAIRTGNTYPPSGTPLAKWQHVICEVGQRREQNIPNVLDALGHNLHILLRHARPEEEGRRLAEPTNDHDEAEYRVGLIEELREGVAWLTRVIEEAEAARRRED